MSLSALSWECVSIFSGFAFAFFSVMIFFPQILCFKTYRSFEGYNLIKRVKFFPSLLAICFLAIQSTYMEGLFWRPARVGGLFQFRLGHRMWPFRINGWNSEWFHRASVSGFRLKATSFLLASQSCWDHCRIH